MGHPLTKVKVVGNTLESGIIFSFAVTNEREKSKEQVMIRTQKEKKKEWSNTRTVYCSIVHILEGVKRENRVESIAFFVLFFLSFVLSLIFFNFSSTILWTRITYSTTNYFFISSLVYS